MKIRSIPIIIGGCLLSFASFIHFFSGYPAVNALLEQGNSAKELIQTVRIIWIFSTITMFLCGVWGVNIGNALRKGTATQWPGMLLGAGITLFGFIGFFIGFPNYHILAFSVPGLLIFLPSLFFVDQPL